MVEWFNPETNPPNDGHPVLGFTEDKKFKVVTRFHGMWDTYQKVICYCELPQQPIINQDEPRVKRGRKVKEK